MIHVFVAEYAEEALAVINSIDTEVFTADVVDASAFVNTVNERCRSGHSGSGRVLLCDGAAVFAPGAVQALDAALDAEPTAALASAYTDGQPAAGEASPHGVLIREGVRWYLDGRLHCYGWERVLAYWFRHGPHHTPWRSLHVVGAQMVATYDPARAAALGPHYYDQLADDELANLIIGGKA